MRPQKWGRGMQMFVRHVLLAASAASATLNRWSLLKAGALSAWDRWASPSLFGNYAGCRTWEIMTCLLKSSSIDSSSRTSVGRFASVDMWSILSWSFSSA